MFTKVYEKIKEIFKENYKAFITMLVVFIVCTVEFPYYINTPGGLINVNDRVSIDGAYHVEGSLNMAYVTEIKATLPTLLISLFNKDWDVLKEEDIVYENETIEDAYYRDHLLLEESINNAIIVGFSKAGKQVEITSSSLLVTYVDLDSETNLKIGDEIISVNGIEINNSKDISEVLKNKKAGDQIYLQVLEDNKELTKVATLKEEDGKVIIGILITEKKEVETIPEVKLKFKKSESGPSGGLMTSLAIYNYLTEEDITHGKKIVGTGTIDNYGNVGSIGGIKYKLKGAIKNGAEIFIVPNGENYKDAIRLKEENNYKIEIIGVSTIDDALNYLMDL
ncbi:MAG: PDZ domain-containing protein [Firmicutes bacterium]|nr:PDZ domain-containing protein [Bacillota bacterium]